MAQGSEKFEQFSNTLKYFLLPPLLLFWLLIKLGQLARFLLRISFRLLFKFLIYLYRQRKLIRFNLLFDYLSQFLIKLHKLLATPQKISRPKKSKKRVRRLIINPLTLTALTSLIILILGFYSFLLVTTARNLPSPTKLTQSKGPLTTQITDRNGQILYRLYEGKNRSLVKLEDLPAKLIEATIAIEDQNFYGHLGVDLKAVTRAIYAYIKDRQVTGASTITQQLIKNTLLTPERTVERKVKEIFLSFWTEQLFTKQEILQMYFNEVPYGGPAWGIAAASQTYFSKEPMDLTLAEIAYLAGLPASPTTYSPYGANPELAKVRQAEVLTRMVEEGYITKEESSQALADKLQINPPFATIKAPHFVMYVRQLLTQRYGDRAVSQGGFRVTTTLDLDLQKKAEQIVSSEVANLQGLRVTNGAAMITESKTGHILAMVGSKDYFDGNGGNFNVATALRQPGSSIKPITYATAFKQGFAPGTVLLDTPVVFKNDWETYAPVNYDGRFHGPVSIRTALASSYNVPAVKMLSLVGVQNMIQTAKELGITTLNDPNRFGLSLTLGGGEVKLIDMMAVYGTFSQLGTRFNSQPILKITDSNGNLIEDNSKPDGKNVISKPIAYLITDILADNRARTPAFGANSLLNIPGSTVAVKTGTTDNKRDNWTFGYTPEFVVGVWVGNNDNTPMDQHLTSGVTGAAPIWHKIMVEVLKGEENLAFERPEGVVEAVVDRNKDLAIAGINPRSIIGMRRRPSPDNKPQPGAGGPLDVEEKKEEITFTDPFSTFTYTPQ